MQRLITLFSKQLLRKMTIVIMTIFCCIANSETVEVTSPSIFPARRDLLKASSGGTKEEDGLLAGVGLGDREQFYNGYQKMLGQVSYTPSVEYQVPRYVSRNNRVGGGMLLAVTRAERYDCTLRFHNIGAQCYMEIKSKVPYGSDPVFRITMSSMYRPDLDGQEGLFYDMSNSSVWINSATNSLRPFSVWAGNGMDEVYPFVLDAGLLGDRAQQMLKYMFEGKYLSGMTKLDVQLATWNPEVHQMVNSRISFELQPSGIFKVEIKTLPIRMPKWNGIDYDVSINFVWACSIVILTAVDINDCRRDIMKKTRTVKESLIFHCFQIGIQLFQMLMVFAYLTFLYLKKYFSMESQYDIYDNLYSAANFLLPYKGERGDVNGEINTLGAMSDESMERWRLEDQPEGMRDFVGLMRDLDYLSLGSFCYWSLQTLNCSMLLLRLLVMIRKNKRLAIVTDTIIEGGKDLLHFFFVFLIIQGGYAFAGIFLFGDQIQEFSTFDEALYSVLYLSIIGDFSKMLSLTHQVGIKLSGSMYFSLTLYCSSVVWLNFFVLMNFVLAIVADALNIVKNNYSGCPTVLDDLFEINKYFYFGYRRGWAHTICRLSPVLDATQPKKTQNKSAALLVSGHVDKEICIMKAMEVHGKEQMMHQLKELQARVMMQDASAFQPDSASGRLKQWACGVSSGNTGEDDVKFEVRKQLVSEFRKEMEDEVAEETFQKSMQDDKRKTRWRKRHYRSLARKARLFVKGLVLQQKECAKHQVDTLVRFEELLIMCQVTALDSKPIGNLRGADAVFSFRTITKKEVHVNKTKEPCLELKSVSKEKDLEIEMLDVDEESDLPNTSTIITSGSGAT